MLFGGASFLYRVFPTWGGQPDAKTIGTFFGAVSNKEGTFDFQAERIPDNWVNLPKPFTLYDMAVEMNDMYYAYPKLFGGNNGAGNFTADALQLPKEKGTVSEFMCFLYDYVTDKSNRTCSTSQKPVTQELTYPTYSPASAFPAAGQVHHHSHQPGMGAVQLRLGCRSLSSVDMVMLRTSD